MIDKGLFFFFFHFLAHKLHVYIRHNFLNYFFYKHEILVHLMRFFPEFSKIPIKYGEMMSALKNLPYECSF